MNKIFKIIKFFIINLSRLIINSITKIIPRDKNIWLFNCVVNSKNKNAFTHNTKYLYLYLHEHPEYEINAIWLSTDKNIIRTLKDNNFNALYKYSLKGLLYCLRAKYYILNVDPAYHNEISKYLCGGAKLINLWHGMPLKIIGLDATTIYQKLPSIFKIFHKLLRLKSNYFITNGMYDTQIFKKAFDITGEQLKILGSPRIDTLNNKFNGEYLFMEKDVKNIVKLKEDNKKIILYVPTFRNNGENVSLWLQNTNLQHILKCNNAVLICKLHPADINSLNTENSETIYKMDNNSDINAILKYTDILITDYSSVNFDYLFLDKPIIYYVPDIDEYNVMGKRFYMPFEEFAVGEVCKTEQELLLAIQNEVNNIDCYKGKRKFLKDKMFQFQDYKNCKRVVEWIINSEK